MIDKSLLQKSLAGTLGMEFASIEEGKVWGRMPVDERTIQPFGYLSGGASLAFAETLAGFGSHILCKENELPLGMHVTANHVRPVPKGGFVEGHGSLIHKGKTSHVWNVDIVNAENKLVSAIRVTNSIVQQKK